MQELHERFMRVSCFDDLEPSFFQKQGSERPNQIVVLDNEHPELLHDATLNVGSRA